MPSLNKDITKIKQILLSEAPFDFEEMAIRIFRYQSEHNKVYQKFIQLRGIKPTKVDSLDQIPFLPISFYKQHKIQSVLTDPIHYFESSGTSRQVRSIVPVFDPSFYLQVSRKIFENEFGPLDQYNIMALLPGYLERQNSSLVYMLNGFMNFSKGKKSGFFLDQFSRLKQEIEQVKSSERKLMIWGVTHALLKFADYIKGFECIENEVIVIETGGMKGMSKELVKEDLYQQLARIFTQNLICSEYGMTELFSQAYSINDRKLRPGFTLKTKVRAIDDPYSYCNFNETGVLCLIDLANLETCSFIETEDLAKHFVDGSFVVLGRLDYSDLRGCNLMVM